MNIAIIGLSGLYPQSETLEKFSDNLQNKRDLISKVDLKRRNLLNLNNNIDYQEVGFLKDIDLFDNHFFNISNKEAEKLSPEQRISLELACKAILDAGYSLKNFSGKKCGVFVCCSDNDYYTLLKEKDGLAWLGSLKSMLAGRISYQFNLQGPNIVFDTGCSSVLVCVDDACKRLERGEIDYALVGGITIYLKFGQKNTDGDLLGIEASNGRCKPFDDSADGIGVGEGGGFILLERREDALDSNNNIYGFIKTTYINGDGSRCSSMTTPSVEGQKDCIVRAWKEGNIDPRQITEIEAHGTGTKLGDPIETESLSESFREYGINNSEHVVHLTSVKGNTGHLNASSGMASITKILLGFKNNVLYPICNYNTPNKLIDFDSSPLKPVKDVIKFDCNKIRLAGINSFGLSGTNGHIVIQNNTVNKVYREINNVEILKLSGKSIKSVENYASDVYQYLSNNELTEEFLYTMNTGRDDYNFCSIITGKNKEEFLKGLNELVIHNRGNCKRRSILFIKDEDSSSVEDLLDKLNINIDYIVDHYSCEEELKNQITELKKENSIIVINKSRDIIHDFVDYNLWNNEALKKFVGYCYCLGYDINWSSLYKSNMQKISVPSYGFDRISYWGKIINCKNKNIENEDVQNVKYNDIGDIKKTLKTIWIKVLECNEKDFKDDTDFFDLGGNSLLINMLVSEIKKVYQVEIPIEDIYEISTIDSQVDEIKSKLSKEIDSTKCCKLLPMQQLMFNSIKHRHDSRWDLLLSFKIIGKLNVEKLNKVFVKICDSHPILKCVIEESDKGCFFKFDDSLDTKVRVFETTSEKEAKDLISEYCKKPVDIMKNTVPEFLIYRINEESSYLLFKISHIISDGWSLNLIFNEIVSLYENDSNDINEIKDFFDYSVEDESRLSTDLGYSLIESIKEKISWMDKRLEKRFMTNDVNFYEFMMFDKEEKELITNLAKKNKTSLFNVILSIYHRTIQEYTGYKKSQISVMLGNREDSDFSNTVGLFARSLISNYQNLYADSIDDTIQRLKKSVAELHKGQFCSIGSCIGHEGKNTFEDFVDFQITYQNFRNSNMNSSELKFQPNMLPVSEPVCPMTIIFFESSSSILSTIQYDNNYFNKEEINKFINIFKKNLKN